MDQKFVYVVQNIKHLWVIMWHIFTSTNNTTTIVFPTQLLELLCTYHVIKQCTEKETTSHSIFLLTIKLNYLHDLKIMFQCSLPHVIHIDSSQYKQLQNSILSITSDHANVWVYIWVLFKSNIPAPLKFMLMLLWYLNLLWVLSHPLLFFLCVNSENKYQVSQRTHCTCIKLNLIDNFNISTLNKTKLCVFTCF